MYLHFDDSFCNSCMLYDAFHMNVMREIGATINNK